MRCAYPPYEKRIPPRAGKPRAPAIKQPGDALRLSTLRKTHLHPGRVSNAHPPSNSRWMRYAYPPYEKRIPPRAGKPRAPAIKQPVDARRLSTLRKTHFPPGRVSHAHPPSNSRWMRYAYPPTKICIRSRRAGKRSAPAMPAALANEPLTNPRQTAHSTAFTSSHSACDCI